ncbi:hypothetical protein EMPG_14984 [Blastomyces silverae]|uniref:Uncharacterized protein n=1 Tax=Blastomyces silverae TaxID=2060906 RepID=A0A0H1BK88_9EURO|nr:hypothetical protein EMPG_14984 [Blastomyces silverae]
MPRRRIILCKPLLRLWSVWPLLVSPCASSSQSRFKFPARSAACACTVSPASPDKD